MAPVVFHSVALLALSVWVTVHVGFARQLLTSEPVEYDTDNTTDAVTPNSSVNWNENVTFSVPLEVPPCDMRCHVPQSTPNLFFMPGKGPLRLLVKKCEIASTEDTTSCSVRLSELFSEVLDATDLYLIHYQELHCPSPTRVVIINNKDDVVGVQLQKMISYLWLVKCDMPWSDIALYGAAVDLRILYLDNWLDNYNEEINNPESIFHEPSGWTNGIGKEPKFLPAGLNKIGSLLFKSRSADGHLPEIFLRYTWPLMAEVAFFNVSLDNRLEGLSISMPRLQTLEVQYSHNNSIPPANFPWDDSLLNLPRNLSRTQNANQHYSRTFTIPGNIYRRVIKWNKCNVADLSDFTFMGNLDKIGITHCHVQAIGAHAFQNVTGVQHIDLSHNVLTALPPLLFHGLDELVQLNLDHNRLESIKQEIFMGLPNLKVLHLNYNRISNIDSRTFYNLDALANVDVSYNRITNVADDAINSESDTLINLDFSHNNIQDLPTWSVLLRNSRKIDFTSNLVTFINFTHFLASLEPSHIVYQHREDATTFDKPKQTSFPKELDLSSCSFDTFEIQRLNETQMKNFRLLIRFFNINLRGNRLYCDCRMFPLFQYLQEQRSDVAFNAFYLENWKCAAPVHLEDTSLSKAEPTAFRCPMQALHCPEECVCYNRSIDGLLQVDCESLGLHQIPQTLPLEAEHLYLRNNSVQKLDVIPAYISHLKVFDICHNNISYISTPFMEALLAVNIINIDYNKLAYYPRALEQLDQRVDFLSLGHNPIKCDCHSTWVRDWILRHRRQVKDFEDVVCASGRGQGEPLVQVPEQDFICEALLGETYRNVLIAMGVLVFLLILITILIFNYRDEIKVLLYMHFNWHPFDKSDDEDTDKIYDAFVSYCSKDYKWVCHILRRKLEQSDPAYKLCLHDRDFLVGAPIEENITQAVNKSRRMIMVLSRNFIKSDWCMLEFRAAHLKVLKDRVKYLILIIFDDIHENELDDDLKIYMKTNTYLSIKNKWFWEKLSYAMPEVPVGVLRPDLPKPKQLTYPDPVLASMPLTYNNPSYRVELDPSAVTARVISQHGTDTEMSSTAEPNGPVGSDNPAPQRSTKDSGFSDLSSSCSL